MSWYLIGLQEHLHLVIPNCSWPEDRPRNGIREITAMNALVVEEITEEVKANNKT